MKADSGAAGFAGWEILVALTGLMFLALVYEGYSERVAQRRAEDFCNTVKLGSGTDGVLERAMSAGADRRQTRWFHDENGIDNLDVTYPAADPIDRHICWIRARDHHVVATKYVYLD